MATSLETANANRYDNANRVAIKLIDVLTMTLTSSNSTTQLLN